VSTSKNRYFFRRPVGASLRRHVDRRPAGTTEHAI